MNAYTKKLSTFLIVFAGLTIGLHAQVRPFPLSAVRLNDGPFLHAQQTDKKYILALDQDRLLYPFYREAGIATNAKSYGNWENSGLDGHTGGHYLSALALMYASTGDAEIKSRLDRMVSELAKCQAKNTAGYVGGVPGGFAMWEDVKSGKIQPDNFSLNGKWVPLYNIHKLFAGLYDAHIVGGNEQAKDVFVKLCDWFAGVIANLSDAQVQNMLRSEHGGLNEVFALAFELTGKEEYATVAKRMSHKKILNPLLAEKDSLSGLHANTQIPKVIGFKKVGEITGDSSFLEAADFFWRTVVENRSVSIGGNSVREHFHPVNDFSAMISSNQGPETCNTYNMMRLSRELFTTNPEARYIDYYERAMFNHILSSQHPVHGGLVYFTPMRPQHYRVYSNVHETFWCCVGSGIENHGKYGEFIYAHDGNDLYVNLFVPSTLTWPERNIKITQVTNLPVSDETTLTVDIAKSSKFKMKIRRPAWVVADRFAITVNGKTVQHKLEKGNYVSIERAWKKGDVVKIKLPMKVGIEMLPDGSPWGSFTYGPVVLAASTDTTDLIGLVADDSRMGHVAEGKFFPVDECPVIVKDSDNFLSAVKRLPGNQLAFNAKSLIYPAAYGDIKLVPFASVHDSRYMIYWPVTTKAGLEEMTQRIKAKEAEALALRARIVDEVLPGEQQPEVEHRFKGDSTSTGLTTGLRWRIASGWFSYELKNDGSAEILRVTYFTGGQRRKFNIIVNDTLIETEVPKDKWDDETITIDYSIPADLQKKTGVLIVKFDAHNGFNTGRIAGVSLMRSENSQ